MSADLIRIVLSSLILMGIGIYGLYGLVAASKVKSVAGILGTSLLCVVSLGLAVLAGVIGPQQRGTSDPGHRSGNPDLDRSATWSGGHVA